MSSTDPPDKSCDLNNPQISLTCKNAIDQPKTNLLFNNQRHFVCSCVCLHARTLFDIVHTSLWISLSRFWMQSSFRLRQRWAAMRFLLRRRMSWMNSSCSEDSLCILMRIWKSFRGRLVIWSTGKGSFT